MGTSRQRVAVRAAIVTPANEILLMRVQDPASGRDVWFAPGGGAEAGETPEETLVRELDEETGFRPAAIGPLIWKRRHVFDWNGERIDQRESFFLVETERFEPVMSEAPGSEWGQFREFRWWTADDLEASGVTHAPRRLPELMRQLASEGPPASPFDAGV